MAETLGPYELVRLLGKGGMGEVHLARDTKLQRDVAIKLLPSELADDPERRARFLREARAAAALNHPNITTILDVGEEDGRDYIAQEYLDGRPLNEIVAAARLPLAELARLAVPLAEALAYAHERGIVHRDIKPANVIVTTRGDPKLLDFGLAKVLKGADGRPDDSSTTLTISGAIFGTPSAMSPEQALGQTVDARSDVFSFGALLYEMATGKPAFLGSTVQETMDKVVHAEPEPLERLRRDLPSDVATIVGKALRKAPSERYQTMAEMAADLRHLKRQTDSGLQPSATTRQGAGRGGRLLLASGLLLAAVGLAWVQGWIGGTPDPTADSTEVTSAAVAGSPAVSVLFVENVSDPADSEHVAVMLSRLLTTDLSAADDLNVVSQQRLFDAARALGRDDGSIDRANATAVARQAGVTTMILAEVDTFGELLVATAEIVDVASGRALGRPKAQGVGIDDIFQVAETLTQLVRLDLGAETLDAETRQALAQHLTTSVAAYRAYVKGRDALFERDFEQASGHLEQAVGEDPAFAVAHYWLAISATWRSMGVEAVEAVNRAAAFRDRLPPELRRTIDAAGFYVRREEERALAALQAVLAEDPDNREALYMLGETTLHAPTVADPSAAADAFARLLQLEPSYRHVRDHLLRGLAHAGRYDEIAPALAAWEQHDGQPDPGLQAVALLLQGRVDEARRMGAMEATGPDGFGSGISYISLLFEDLAELESHPTYGSARLRAKLEAKEVWPVSDGHAYTLVFASAGQLAYAEALLVEHYLETTLPLYAQPTSQLIGLLTLTELRWLRGDLAGARQVSARTVERIPRSVRFLYLDAVLAAMDGDDDTVALRHKQLSDLTTPERSPIVGAYRDGAAAELALVGGDAAAARRIYESVLASNLLPMGWYADGNGNTLWVRWRLAEACRQLGDTEAARAALVPVGDPCMDWSESLLWLQILHDLGVMELDAGNEARGRQLLQRLLGWWGEVDVDVPIVESARERL